jgi:EAL domain-containing protein (putative c-di-GMP-specific phosphodiesterase class I)
MHAGRFIDMGDTLRDSLTLLLQSIGTKLLITGVESKEELEKIEELGADYFIII